jgi:5-methylcytosine-specific restriction endonuclease McrBC regulatory subunit McrC
MTPPPHYREAFQIARLLLAQQLPLSLRGQVMFKSCLFNTEQVFERYIIEISKRIATIESRVMIHPVLMLDEDETIRIRPDLVVLNDTQVKAIIDAKYKATTTSADLYQMLAYCNRLACRLGILVVPSSEQKQVRIQARDQSIISIHTIGIDLDGITVDLDHLEQQFLSSVGEVLNSVGSM